MKEMEEKTVEKENRISITFTALVWVGILLCISGAVVAVLGFGSSTVFEVHIGSVEVKTTQVGLAILVVGALLSFFTAQKLPTGVMILADKPTFMEKLLRRVPIMSVMIRDSRYFGPPLRSKSATG